MTTVRRGSPSLPRPDGKFPLAERLEPEDMVLKAKVETLQAKVKEAAANVKSLRASAPVQIKQKLSASLKQASEGLPTSAAQMQGPSEETKEAKVSAAARRRSCRRERQPRRTRGSRARGLARRPWPARLPAPGIDGAAERGSWNLLSRQVDSPCRAVGGVHRKFASWVANRLFERENGEIG